MEYVIQCNDTRHSKARFTGIEIDPNLITGPGETIPYHRITFFDEVFQKKCSVKVYHGSIEDGPVLNTSAMLEQTRAVAYAMSVMVMPAL